MRRQFTKLCEKNLSIDYPVPATVYLINAMSESNTKIYDRAQFTIRIRDLEQDRMFVEVINSPFGRMRRPEPVVFNRQVIPFIKKLANPLKEGEMTQEELIEMGQMLGDMLFPMQVRRMFMKSWEAVYKPEEKKGMRIILELDDDKLSLLPWEYVYIMEYKHMRNLRQNADEAAELKDLIKAINRDGGQLKILKENLRTAQGDLPKLERELQESEETPIKG